MQTIKQRITDALNARGNFLESSRREAGQKQDFTTVNLLNARQEEIHHALTIFEELTADQELWQARWQYFKRVLQTLIKLAEADNKTIDNDDGLAAMKALFSEIIKLETIDDLEGLQLKEDQPQQ